jgi:hypothetical protein
MQIGLGLSLTIPRLGGVSPGAVGLFPQLDGHRFFYGAADGAYQGIDFGAAAEDASDPVQTLKNLGEWSARANLTRPPNFPFDPPFTITRTGPQAYNHDFDWTDYQIIPATTYYVSPTGNDANDGLSAGAPKTLNGLVAALNSSPADVTIILAPGAYIAGLAGLSMNFNANLLCPDGVARLHPALATGWTKTAGRANIWQTTMGFSASAYSVADLTDQDDFGIERKLAWIGSADLATLDATPRSAAASGATLYVHLHDGREPDADVLAFNSNAEGWQQVHGRQITFQNVAIWGYDRCGYINHSAAGRYVFKDCQFRYSLSDNNFEADSALTAATRIYIQGGDSSYSREDCYSYRGDVQVCEIDCTAVYGGFFPVPANNNTSTGHNSAAILRVNGVYRHANRVIHDINSCRIWMIGCVIGDSNAGGNDPFNSIIACAGNRATNDDTVTWLEGCTCLGGAVSDIGAYGPSSAILIDCAGFAIPASDATGAIVENRYPASPGAFFTQSNIALQPAIADADAGIAFSSDRIDGSGEMRSLISGAAGVTFAMLINPDALSGTQYVYFQSTSGSNTSVRLAIGITSTGAVNIIHRRDDSTNVTHTTSGGVVTAGDWQNIGVTLEFQTGGAGAARVFKDGTLVQSFTISNTGVIASGRSNIARIGDYTGTNPFNGKIGAILLAASRIDDVAMSDVMDKISQSQTP